jgi:hypothetical protein
MTRYRYSKLFRELREIVKFYHFFRVVIFQIHFESGTARIQIRTDFFRIWILLKVSDPTGFGSVSGSTTLFSYFLGGLFWPSRSGSISIEYRSKVVSRSSTFEITMFTNRKGDAEVNYIGTY